MSAPADPLEAAIRNLWQTHTYEHEGVKIELALLLREAEWRPLKAAWWHGKEACIIGADLSGNFLLRHCDGSVRYWLHSKGVDVVLSPSVKAFAAALAKQSRA